MSNKNKHNHNRLPTQPTRMANVKPADTQSVISNEVSQVKTEETVQLLTEPVITPVAAVEAPVESKNISQNYCMVSIRGDSQLFQFEVNQLLNNGWELVGGVATSMYMDGYTAIPIWSQALIKQISN